MKLLTFILCFIGTLVLVKACVPNSGVRAGTLFGSPITWAVVIAFGGAFLVTRKG